MCLIVQLETIEGMAWKTSVALDGVDGVLRPDLAASMGYLGNKPA
jgi:2-keto-3-deoxy-L-rhamnonate aldolase RhmA